MSALLILECTKRFQLQHMQNILHTLCKGASFAVLPEMTLIIVCSTCTDTDTVSFAGKHGCCLPASNHFVPLSFVCVRFVFLLFPGASHRVRSGTVPGAARRAGWGRRRREDRARAIGVGVQERKG